MSVNEKFLILFLNGSLLQPHILLYVINVGSPKTISSCDISTPFPCRKGANPSRTLHHGRFEAHLGLGHSLSHPFLKIMPPPSGDGNFEETFQNAAACHLIGAFGPLVQCDVTILPNICSLSSILVIVPVNTAEVKRVF